MLCCVVLCCVVCCRVFFSFVWNATKTTKHTNESNNCNCTINASTHGSIKSNNTTGRQTAHAHSFLVGGYRRRPPSKRRSSRQAGTLRYVACAMPCNAMRRTKIPYYTRDGIDTNDGFEPYSAIPFHFRFEQILRWVVPSCVALRCVALLSEAYLELNGLPVVALHRIASHKSAHKITAHIAYLYP